MQKRDKLEVELDNIKQILRAQQEIFKEMVKELDDRISTTLNANGINMGKRRR